MPVMIQLRHVPDELHTTLKVKAAQEGLSLSDYIIREISSMAHLPSNAEMLERLRSRPRVKLKIRPAEIIRQMRDGR